MSGRAEHMQLLPVFWAAVQSAEPLPVSRSPNRTLVSKSPGFLFAHRRERNVMRVRAHGAVEVILRNGIKRPSCRGQTPEAASRWFCALKLFHSGRRRIKERNRNGSPLQ